MSSIPRRDLALLHRVMPVGVVRQLSVEETTRFTPVCVKCCRSVDYVRVIHPPRPRCRYTCIVECHGESQTIKLTKAEMIEVLKKFEAGERVASFVFGAKYQLA